MSYKTEIIIEVKGMEFKLWQEEGYVYQSGRFELPEVLQSFGNTPSGRREAGAYIAGIYDLAKWLNTTARWGE